MQPTSLQNPIAQATEPQAIMGQRTYAREHFVTAGEKKFDRMTYTTVGYVINALLSVVAVAAVERTQGGQRMMENFRHWAERNVTFVKPETAKMLATKSFFLSGGFAVLAPMKWLEDAKVSMVKKWNREIYGERANTDTQILESERELSTAPKQSWGSIFSSRVLALVPFYAGYALLWDKKSTLSKATNEAVFIDKPIVAASRGIGKAFAKLTGNAKVEAQIAKLSAEHPGEMQTLLPPKATRAKVAHDPAHSTVPYYFISEAITSGMVAWGVYALSRVLAPIMGHKKYEEPTSDMAKVAHTAASTVTTPVVADVARDIASLDSHSRETIQRVLAHGVQIRHFQPKPEMDQGGYYDAEKKTVFINATRPKERQLTVLVHECQHARNLFDGLVVDKHVALEKGKPFYVENFLRDEALAHAASFIHAHEAKSQEELGSAVVQALFKDVPYTGADAQAFTRYADHAMDKLKEGAQGYLKRANESYEAHMAKAQKKDAAPDTHIAAETVSHERAVAADAALERA